MSISSESNGERLIRLGEVERITGLKKSCLYVLCKKGEFPAGVKLSARAVAWPLSSVESWIADRIRASTRGAQK